MKVAITAVLMQLIGKYFWSQHLISGQGSGCLYVMINPWFVGTDDIPSQYSSSYS
jgi:hypothetical protein